MADVTRADLKESEDRIIHQMDRGFTGINTRLDELNGRVRKGEVAEAEHLTRIKNIEREVFERPVRHDHEPHDLEQAPLNVGSAKWIVGIVVGIVIGTYVVMTQVLGFMKP